MFSGIARLFRREPTRAEQAAAALAAVAAAREGLARRSRETEPAAWADAQFELGRALRAYGEVREPRGVTAAESEAEAAAKVAPFVDAEAPLRAALEVSTRETAPDRWAEVQQELARVLRRTGEKCYEDRSWLAAAAEAARAALEVRTREHVPDAWLESQLELAEILFSHASNNDPEDPARYGPAIDAFRTAAEQTALEDPLQLWGWTRYRLALVLMHAGSMAPAAPEVRQAMLRESMVMAQTAAAWADSARDEVLAHEARSVGDYAQTFLQMHDA